MKALTAGYDYLLNVIGNGPGATARLTLQGDMAGVTVQEVCRALIDHFQHVPGPHDNFAILRHLRCIMIELEERAARKRNEYFPPTHEVELEPPCSYCGYIHDPQIRCWGEG